MSPADHRIIAEATLAFAAAASSWLIGSVWGLSRPSRAATRTHPVEPALESEPLRMSRSSASSDVSSNAERRLFILWRDSRSSSGAAVPAAISTLSLAWRPRVASGDPTVARSIAAPRAVRSSDRTVGYAERIRSEPCGLWLRPTPCAAAL